MLDHAVGVAGQQIVDGDTIWKVPSWTLGALGALRDNVFQKALRTTFVDGLPDAAQSQDRSTLRRAYAIGSQFEPYRLIYDGALDDEDNLAVFLHHNLLKHHSSMTLAATRELVAKQRDVCLVAVLNANPRMPRPSDQSGTAGIVASQEAAPGSEAVGASANHLPTNGQPSSEASSTPKA